MKIKVLGSSGAEMPGHRPPSFLLDGKILFDTGSLTNILDAKKQWKIETIFITHPHLDHIMGIPFLADNLLFMKKGLHVKVISISPVIKAIKKNLLDGSIWPDFTIIPSMHEAILNLQELKSGESIRVNHYTITPYPVNHSVPATGYLVEDHREKRFFYTGDTGPSDTPWRHIGEKQIHCLIIEVSFPNRMEEIAIKTGHLTPRLLAGELQKIKHLPERIFIIHLKPQFFISIQKELRKLKLKNIRILKGGEVITV